MGARLHQHPSYWGQLEEDISNELTKRTFLKSLDILLFKGLSIRANFAAVLDTGFKDSRKGQAVPGKSPESGE